MDLIINGTAIRRSSLGARRYYEGVMRHLHWPGGVSETPLASKRWLERPNELLARGRHDAIFWSPSHRGSLLAHNHIVTVLDCINIEYVYRNDWRLPLLRGTFGLLLANARAVVTISHATRDAVLKHFPIDPAKVVAIPGPVDFEIEMAVPELTVAAPDTVLMITNRLPHKNTLRAARALAASSAARRGVVLRVIGALDPDGLAACEKAGVVVEQHSGVPDSVLRQWLRQALFLFSPSLQEGLNLPIAESLSCNGNVLCSDIPVHREFYEDAVLYFDPLSEVAMTNALDAAFARARPWNLPPPVHPRRTFADVAREYRKLFQQVAEQNFPVSAP